MKNIGLITEALNMKKIMSYQNHILKYLRGLMQICI